MIIKSSSQLSESIGVKILVYGQAGVGKTMLCATCPNPIILSAEAGLMSLSQKNCEKVFGKGKYEYPVIEIDSMVTLQEAYMELTRSKQFATICIDSISEIAEIVLTKSKSQNKDGRMAYGDMIDQMVKILKDFRKLPFNIYMSCKAERIKDDLLGGHLISPMMPGTKLAPQIPYIFDEVLYLKTIVDQKGVLQRVLQTNNDGLAEGKDRSGKLSPLEPAHLGHIINKIKE